MAPQLPHARAVSCCGIAIISSICCRVPKLCCLCATSARQPALSAQATEHSANGHTALQRQVSQGVCPAAAETLRVFLQLYTACLLCCRQPALAQYSVLEGVGDGPLAALGGLVAKTQQRAAETVHTLVHGRKGGYRDSETLGFHSAYSWLPACCLRRRTAECLDSRSLYCTLHVPADPDTSGAGVQGCMQQARLTLQGR